MQVHSNLKGKALFIAPGAKVKVAGATPVGHVVRPLPEAPAPDEIHPLGWMKPLGVCKVCVCVCVFFLRLAYLQLGFGFEVKTKVQPPFWGWVPLCFWVEFCSQPVPRLHLIAADVAAMALQPGLEEQRVHVDMCDQPRSQYWLHGFLSRVETHLEGPPMSR